MKIDNTIIIILLAFNLLLLIWKRCLRWTGEETNNVILSDHVDQEIMECAIFNFTNNKISWLLAGLRASGILAEEFNSPYLLSDKPSNLMMVIFILKTRMDDHDWEEIKQAFQLDMKKIVLITPKVKPHSAKMWDLSGNLLNNNAKSTCFYCITKEGNIRVDVARGVPQEKRRLLDNFDDFLEITKMRQNELAIIAKLYKWMNV